MSRSILVAAVLAYIAAMVGTTPAAPVPNTVPSDEQERLLARSKKFIQQGKIDLYVILVAALKLKPDDVRMWEPAADFGRKLIERAEMKDHHSKPLGTPSSYKDLATYLDRYKPEFKRLNEMYFRPDPSNAIPPIDFYKEAIQAPGVVDPTGIANCLILSRGSVQSGFGIQSSVVFANGDMTARTIVWDAVIACDGDVTVGEHIHKCVIVARGNITAKRGLSNVVLMAGGKVTLENKKTIKGEHLILENKPNTLGVVFFELSTVGVEVKVVEKSVEVSGVTAWKPCGKAGLKAGDVILEVSGKKPTDAESLRRLLRDALALGDASVKLKRGNDTLTVKVSLPE